MATAHIPNTFRRGWTLVELLVVFAIVAILAALITVASLAGIRSAKTKSCAANLSQIFSGLEIYSADHDGYHPPFPLMGMIKFGRQYPAREIEYKKSLMTAGVVDDQFYCPLDSLARKGNPPNVFYSQNHKNLSYVSGRMGFETWNPDGTTMFSLAMVRDPEMFILFADDGTGVRTDSAMTFVSSHGEMQNILYADGHVRYLPSPKLPY